jgi:hypothetical protein
MCENPETTRRPPCAFNDFKKARNDASSATVSITGDTFPLTGMFALCLGRFIFARIRTY